jgi:hypothetical protein
VERTKYKAFYPESVYLSTVVKNLETAEPLSTYSRVFFADSCPRGVKLDSVGLQERGFSKSHPPECRCRDAKSEDSSSRKQEIFGEELRDHWELELRLTKIAAAVRKRSRAAGVKRRIFRIRAILQASAIFAAD